MNYHLRIIGFQTYLLETIWEAGAIKGSTKVKLSDLELQENLAGANKSNQHAKHIDNQAVKVGVKRRRIQKEYNPCEASEQQYCDNTIIIVKDHKNSQIIILKKFANKK